MQQKAKIFKDILRENIGAFAPLFSRIKDLTDDKNPYLCVFFPTLVAFLVADQ